MPKDELWQLFRAAYEQYQSEIINEEKAYSRYVNDFFNYHLPVLGMKEADVKLHFMHVCALKELLEKRLDLVEHFFTKENFEECDFHQMYKHFNSGTTLNVEHERLTNFSEQQIKLITEFTNRLSLFKKEVTTEEISALFSCTLKTPLQASSNRYIALFLGTLRDQGFLPYSWQMIIEGYKLLSSSTSNKPISASQMRSNLTQARKVKRNLKENSDQKNPNLGFAVTCLDFVKQLKKSL